MEDEKTWGTDENHEWSLFTNKEAELIIAKQKVEQKVEKKVPKQKTTIDNPAFFFTKTKTDTKGGLIYTPQGYGVIQDFTPDGKSISVKVNNVTQQFKRSEVSYEIPLNISFYSGNTKFDSLVYFPIHMTVSELLDKIAEMDVEDDRVASIRAFYNGKEIVPGTQTLEKYGILPGNKLLVIVSLGKMMKINRFASITSSWSYNSNYVDAITFTASKNIKVIGYGMYVPCNDNALNGQIRLVAGADAKGSTVLATKDVSLRAKGPDVTDRIQKVLFDRAIPIRAGEKYSCVSELKIGNSFYGSGGKISVTGEKDVIFTFTTCSGSVNGTGTGSGQFPEIYYYA